MGAFWNQRWKTIEEALPSVDWKNFRDTWLVQYIQTNPKKVWEWITICAEDGVPLDWMIDSEFGNPNGETVDGRFVTASSARHAHQAHRILSRWTPQTPVTVVEVGAGYGGFPRLFHRLLNVAAYVLVDAKPILEIQRRYLEATTDFDRFSYLEFGQAWPDCELVLNSNSFAEMEPWEVDWYFGQIQSKLTDGGRLYVTNRAQHQTDFDRYPYDEYWRHDLTKHIGGMFVECFSERDKKISSQHPYKEASWHGQTQD